jgi:hypothetical protein
LVRDGMGWGCRGIYSRWSRGHGDHLEAGAVGSAGCQGREGVSTQLDRARVGEALQRGCPHKSAAEEENEGGVKGEHVVLEERITGQDGLWLRCVADMASE